MHPAQDMGDILTGTGFLAYLEKVRKNEMEAYDALMEAAHLLRVAIRRSSPGRAWAFGVDNRVIARKITRPIVYMADCHLEAAKAAGVSAAIFRGSLAGPTSGSMAGGKSFDPNK
jgi:hypothetical protein